MEKAKSIICEKCGKTFIHEPIYQEDKYDKLCPECFTKDMLGEEIKN